MHTLHFTETQIKELIPMLKIAQKSFPEPYGQTCLKQLREHMASAPKSPKKQGNGWSTPGPLGRLDAEVTV